MGNDCDFPAASGSGCRNHLELTQKEKKWPGVLQLWMLKLWYVRPVPWKKEIKLAILFYEMLHGSALQICRRRCQRPILRKAAS